MKFRLHRLVAIVGLVLVAVADTSAGASAAAPRHSGSSAAHVIGLSPRDVRPLIGQAFNFVFRTVVTREAAILDHAPVKVITHHGRIIGYETLFTRQVRQTDISVVDSASVYRTSAGAAWEYGVITHLSRPAAGSTLLRLPGLGDVRQGFIEQLKNSKAHEMVLQVIFRRGRYTVALNVHVPVTYHIQNFVRLAHILDAQAQRAG